MFNNKKAVLIFGVGPLQRSIIERAKLMGLYTVGIDPSDNAICRHEVDAFELVGGQDFEGTCNVVERYGIDAIVTAATDKPLVMMARIAEKYGFPFFSVESAIWSTDKYQMKQRFMENGIPCAKGRLIKSVDEVNDFEYPIIVKPRDNSGSRGVKLCRSKEEIVSSIYEALEVSRFNSVLVEEFIEGQEYSIESIHQDKRSDVIQFTEKKTTEFPYNVELGHKQPANLSEQQKIDIRNIISIIASSLNFTNCASHTELKINNRGIFVIETSPRLGGDFITSDLTPLSTGINIEDMLLHIALKHQVDLSIQPKSAASGISFFSLPQGTITSIESTINEVISWPGIYNFEFTLHEGDYIHPITNSLNRYGQFIISTFDRANLDLLMENYSEKIHNMIKLKK